MKGQANAQIQQNSTMIRLHDQGFLENQRAAGKVVAKTLKMLEGLVREKTTKTMLELDRMAHDFITSQGCIPTFYLYKGFQMQYASVLANSSCTVSPPIMYCRKAIWLHLILEPLRMGR